jgi:hypothetical protein
LVVSAAFTCVVLRPFFNVAALDKTGMFRHNVLTPAVFCFSATDAVHHIFFKVLGGPEKEAQRSGR